MDPLRAVATAWLRRFREPVRRNGVLLGVLALGGLGFLPQLGGPGYDSALVSGLVLPGLAAAMTALEVSAERPAASVAVARGAGLGIVLGALGFLVMLLHGARVGFCDPSEGILIFVLGPGFGAVAGGVWGALAGLVTSRVTLGRKPWARRTAAITLALAGPLAGIVVSLVRFVTSPMVFAFDPFFGVFSGPLYDTVVNVSERLETYRAGTIATLTAVTLGAVVFERARERGPWTALAEKPGVALLALVTGALSIAHSAAGPRFGHWSTVASIEEALGGHQRGHRCDVIYPRALAARDAELFTRDCDTRVPEIEAFYGARGPEHIRVFLFSNDGEKGWLMGASHTYIAKPWREEVYVQEAAYPHPVLSHELAHVIAGSFARGPFRVAGPLGGVWPDPGRIEGFAVAAAPDETDELTVTEWAASMQKLGLLPPLRTVFELEFLGISASRAYTVAGAFVVYLRERYGSEALRRWYGGASLPAVFGGKDLTALEHDFHAALGAVSVPERALATAKARFEQPAFFARRCPRIVDRALGEGNQRLAAGDVKGADEGFHDALALDPNNVDARFGLAGCARRRGDTDRALERYGTLADDKTLPKPQAAHALETSADIELGRGHDAAAHALYTEALELVFDEDRRRTLEVKRLASDGTAREAVIALLIGNGDWPPAWDVAAPLLQAWADAHPTDDVAPYLIGRNVLLAGRYPDAMKYLDRSLSFTPALASVRREALRLRLIAGCALGRDPERAVLLGRALSDPDLPLARRVGLQRMMGRCPTEVAAVIPSSVATPAVSPPDATSPNVASPNVASPDTPSPNAASTVSNDSAAAPQTPKKPSDGVSTCPTGMQRIPGGKFWVGADPSEHFADDESPRYLTELPAFCMDETEVTAGAYAACVAKDRCAAPERQGILCNFGRPERTDHPMNCVTWDAADAYCRLLDARLPSEVELEYVARGGSEYLKYPWGDAAPDEQLCWKHPGTCKVKSYPPGVFGLSDVSGNVWEWGADWYGSYPWPPLTGYAKVYRGGSFSRRFEKWLHTRLRNRMAPNQAGAHLGFRCAATLADEPCPFGEESPGVCRHGVLERDCPNGKTFNGARCVEPGETRCREGWVEVPGHGCVLRVPEEPVIEDVQASARDVKRERTSEFDADCRQNSRDRPHAFRYVGGSHAARNLVSRRSGCKNRDVGVGWNSACCP
jgi:formylglycine-generating enzyme required for sulfatase activity/tetratricopeptide (TPR) repeat protein